MQPADQRAQADAERFVDEMWSSGQRMHRENQNTHRQNVMDVIRLHIKALARSSDAS
ncbi:MAG TPA: hypothetical protein VMS38_08755 [Pseudorhodoferax sp.]|nr:hypothetical protein [Pseudorhodoferax sp.]